MTDHVCFPDLCVMRHDEDGKLVAVFRFERSIRSKPLFLPDRSCPINHKAPRR